MSYGQIAYEAFHRSIVSHGAKAWKDLPKEHQYAWEAAADAVSEEIRSNQDIKD